MLDCFQSGSVKTVGGVSLMRALALAFIFALLGVAGAQARGPELIMFEQRGCEWCEVWMEEIAPVLPKTPEGKCAKFSRFDIHNPSSDLLKKIKPIIYTPTFVVLEDGKEVGRVLGYAGEDFFWFHLATQLKKLERKCELPD